ncbi:hypothetical protein OGAPHI_007222 [Ogataea philodendri]|uniref:Serine protease n=1 Tax=Ogataea philodendri TaxID=1378263 RepID=A0A9P8NUR8_9ASCO|nr:uncharacterized protein OGAPHI_007222 [Ogataea philodendri]KAH3660017.1 hypothetical protein OGAPHI_007222 [Ogataea philodendri]
METKYSSIIVRISDCATKSLLCTLSGLILQLGNKTLVVTLVALPNNVLIGDKKIDVYIALESKDPVCWIRCDSPKFVDVDEKSIAHLTMGGFKVDTVTGEDIERCRFVVAEVRGLAFEGNYSRISDRVEVGDECLLEASPFSSTSHVFHGYTSTATICYKKGGVYLSDLKYLENMEGGVVTVDGSIIGVVMGVLRKLDGQGNLMIVLSLSHGELAEFGLCSAQLPTMAPLNEFPFVVGISGKLDGTRYWGSGVIVKDNMIATNRHVVFSGNQLAQDLALHYRGNTIELGKLVAGVDVLVPFDGQLCDLCFIKKNLAFDSVAKLPNELTISNAASSLEILLDLKDNSRRLMRTKSVAYGLFCDSLHLHPLISRGCINSVVELKHLFRNIQQEIQCLTVSSSSCWSGSSGGALLNKKNELLGLMSSNGRTASGETLTKLTLVIPIQLVVLGYYDLFRSKVSLTDSAASKYQRLLRLDSSYSEIFMESKL